MYEEFEDNDKSDKCPIEYFNVLTHSIKCLKRIKTQNNNIIICKRFSSKK